MQLVLLKHWTLEDGSRVVITMTNQSAWVGSKQKVCIKSVINLK